MEQVSKLPLDTDSILVHFNLPRLREGKLIDEWVTTKGVLNPGESERIEKLYRKALKSGDGWNEEELKMKFISLLFDLADIEEEDKIISFFKRPMNATFNGTKIGVICDCLLASPAGISTPKTPYFFLQERNAARFKKQKGDNNDPEAQMLAAMLVAQHKNADNKPIHGAWLVGNIWNFTLLQGNEYFVSHKFDASDLEDLTQIVFILRRLKELIKSR
jgi:hypothetical protein